MDTLLAFSKALTTPFCMEALELFVLVACIFRQEQATRGWRGLENAGSRIPCIGETCRKTQLARVLKRKTENDSSNMNQELNQNGDHENQII